MNSTAHPRIAGSAFRHGVPEQVIRHALRNSIRYHGPDDEGLLMIIGSTPDGSLVECGLVQIDGDSVVVHAMPARPKFLDQA